MSKYEIGYQFTPYNSKNKKVVTIIDILTTYNGAGELVKTEYIGVHDCIGQKVTGTYLKSTIDRSVLMGVGNSGGILK